MIIKGNLAVVSSAHEHNEFCVEVTMRDRMKILHLASRLLHVRAFSPPDKSSSDGSRRLRSLATPSSRQKIPSPSWEEGKPEGKSQIDICCAIRLAVL